MPGTMTLPQVTAHRLDSRVFEKLVSDHFLNGGLKTECAVGDVAAGVDKTNISVSRFYGYARKPTSVWVKNVLATDIECVLEGLRGGNELAAPVHLCSVVGESGYEATALLLWQLIINDVLPEGNYVIDFDGD